MIRTLSLLILMAGPVAAHDWYPRACCSDRDCYPLSFNEVEATPEGWRIKATGEVVPYEEARETPPEGGGRFFRCSRAGDPSLSTLREYLDEWSVGDLCFWAPPVGF